MESVSVSTLLPPEVTIEDCQGDQDIYDLKLKAREKVLLAVGYIESDGWNLIKDEGGCAFYYKEVEGESLNITLRKFDIESPMEKVLEKVLDPEMATKTNDRVKESKIIEVIDENSTFLRREVIGNLIVSNRDMSVFQHIIELTDGSKVLVTFSHPHEEIPEVSGVVRAEFIVSYTHLKSISETTTSIVNLVHFDPKGSIPTVLINLLQNKQHEAVIKFKKFLEEDTG